MHKKTFKYCLLYKKYTLKDEKTGKNVDRYSEGCYPKSKLKATKKRACSKKRQCFDAKAFIF